jgi:hypothetical protein
VAGEEAAGKAEGHNKQNRGREDFFHAQYMGSVPAGTNKRRVKAR